MVELAQDLGVAEAGQLGRVAGGEAVRAGFRELRPGSLLRIAAALPLGGGRGAAGFPADRVQRRQWAGIWC
ncbi:hypothetical protein GCM10009827_046290 [Dactylosporangium maewongense]|uniref:Uncharacterized protein n=1 Tax=Dactylosporangium maewongense TaxID=634393 RepID=A0ABN2AQ42_9ACTN